MQCKNEREKKRRLNGKEKWFCHLAFSLSLFRSTMTETETETQGSSAFGRSNGAPDASVMQDALLRLLRGQRAASEVRGLPLF